MTTLQQDIAFINALFESLYRQSLPVAPAREDPADDGVPPEMRAGPVDSDGWVRWKMLPSTLTEADLAPVTRRLRVVLPSLVKAYLLGNHHLFTQVTAEDQLFMIPDTPIDRPLDAFIDQAKAWAPLLRAGLLPFGEYGDGWGPCCIDLNDTTFPSDNRVVWLEHEHFHSMRPAQQKSRGSLQSLLQPLYPSFRSFLEATFSKHPNPSAEAGAA